MTIFQPFRSSISESPIITTITGASTTITHTGYIKVFFQNLAGVNLGSTAVQFSIVAGQGIRISIPAIMVKSGELPEYYIIGCSSTGNTGTYVQIAKIKALSPSGNLIPLPLSVDINSDNSFNLNLTSADYISLPVNVSLGKLAIDLSTGTYYQKELTEWIPFWKGNTFLIEPNSIDTNGGYLQPSLSLDNFTEDIIYEGDGQFSRNFYIGYLNDSLFDIPESTLIGLAVLINGSPSSSLAGRLEIRLMGYVSLTSGLLDAAPATGYPTLIWESDRDSSFIIPEELPSQSVALFIIRFNYSDSELSTINPNSTIALDLFLYNEGSVKAEFGSFTGNFIVDIENNLEVTPNVGLSLNINSGQVLINRRLSSIKPSQIISGLIANTINQKLIIDVELNARIEQNTYIKNVREEILAIVGTSPYEHITNLSANINLSSIGGIEINLVNYVGTSKIRNTYPDQYIAGKDANYNVEKINVYLVEGNNIYKYTIDAILFSSQSIVINDLPPTVTALPTNLDNTKGLFEIQSFTLTTTTGTIPANSYTVYISYEWLGDSITKIQMESSYLTVKLNSINDLLSGSPKFDVLKLRSINYDPITNTQEIAIYNKNNILYKRLQSNETPEEIGTGGSITPVSGSIGGIGLEYNFSELTTINTTTGVLRFNLNDSTPIYDDSRLTDIFYIYVNYFDSSLARPNNSSLDVTEYLIDATRSYLVQVSNKENGTYALFYMLGGNILNANSALFDVGYISGKLQINNNDKLLFQWQHKNSDINAIDETYSATFIPNLSNGYNFFKINLTGNITIQEPFGVEIGTEWEVLLKQDATGGRTLTLIDYYTSEPLVLSTSPDAIDIIKFKCIDTNFYIANFEFKNDIVPSGGGSGLLTNCCFFSGQPISIINTDFDMSPLLSTIYNNGFVVEDAGYSVKVLQSGIYLFTMSVSFTAGASGPFQILIPDGALDGPISYRGMSSSNGVTSVTISGQRAMNANDKVFPEIRNRTGTTRTFTCDQFSAVKIADLI